MTLRSVLRALRTSVRKCDRSSELDVRLYLPGDEVMSMLLPQVLQRLPADLIRWLLLHEWVHLILPWRDQS